MSHLNGKNVLISGGTKGIGFATAEHFSKLGANVVITGSSQQSIDQALEKSQQGFSGLVCDLKSMQHIHALPEQLAAHFSHLDIFFANAGIAHFQPLEHMTEDLFDEMMNINVKGLYFSIQQVVPMMTGSGVVVVTASIAPRKGQPGMAPYAASKGAARAIVRSLAAELVERGIRINCLSPGPVHTEIFSRMVDGDEQKAQEIVDRLSSTVPAKRVGTVEEMALAVEFLCGPGADYMLGSELTLDGGKAEL